MIQKYFFGSNFEFKLNIYQFINIVIITTGLVLRGLAFYYAKNNFNHNIETKARENHRLIRHGIYKYERHPSYLGFFIFTISTLLYSKAYLASLISCYILWNFFKARIIIEEHFLSKKFRAIFDTYKLLTKSLFDKRIILIENQNLQEKMAQLMLK